MTIHGASPSPGAGVPLDLRMRPAAQPPSPPDAIEKLVARLEQALAGGDRAALLALTVKDTDASTVDDFAEAAGANPTRVVIKERDRLTLEGNRRQLLIEVFVERGIEAKLATWRVDLRPPAAKADPNDWRIERMEAGLERRGPLPARAERHASVRRPQPRRHRHRRDHRDGRRHRVRRRDSRRPDGDRAARTRTHAVCAARSGRAHADPALHRRRRSASRSSTPRSCASRPSDFESRFRAESLVPRPVVADRSAPRHRGLRRVPLAHAPDRSHRSRAAIAGRSSRRRAT